MQLHAVELLAGRVFGGFHGLSMPPTWKQIRQRFPVACFVLNIIRWKTPTPQRPFHFVYSCEEVASSFPPALPFAAASTKSPAQCPFSPGNP